MLLTLCAAVIIGTGMLMDYRLNRDGILDRVQRESQDTINAVVIDMENWLDGVESSTLLMARILQQREYSHEGLQQILRDAVEVNDDIYGAAIALAPGQAGQVRGFAPYFFRRNGELAYANLADPDYNYRAQAWYTDAVAAQAPLWVEPYYDEGGGKILMTTFAVPVYRKTDTGERFLYAVVTADVSLAELHDYLQRLRLGDSGFGTLLSRNGTILSGRNPANIMRHYSDTIVEEVDHKTWQEMFDAALQGQVVIRHLTCADVPGRCVIRLGTLESTGWPVGVVYSEEEITKPLREFELKTALIGLLTMLLMAVAVAIVTRRLTRPLKDLTRASDRIAQGDLDAPLPAVRGNDEVARLIQSFTAMKKDLKSYIADLETATARRSRLEGELGAAREIQMAMLPHGGEAHEVTADFGLWARVLPARSVGGDLYSYFCRDRLLFIAVGDVSDKGVPASLFMARAMSLIQQLAATADDPATATALLNEALTSGNDNCMFVTLFLGILDLDSLELRFASAGHTAPSLVRDGGVSSLLQDTGPALGLSAELEFPTNTVALQPADRLAIFTDGIDEAFNEQDEMFGIARFNAALLAADISSTGTAGSELFDSLAAFTGNTPQSDDITLLLLDIAGKGQPAVEASSEFAIGPKLTGRVEAWLREALEHLAPPQEALGELLVAIEEIVSNVYKYAQLPAGSVLRVTAQAGPQQIEVEVADGGTAFNPLEQAQRAELGASIDDATVGGLGVHLITTMTEQQSYRRADGCNILRVTKFLANPQA